jgi:hypothetical protein
MITSEMLTSLSSSRRDNFRELPVWGEARCLTLAVHELATRIQDSAQGAALAAEIQTVCVTMLARIIDAYEGNKMDKATQLLGETDELLTRLDGLLNRTLTAGMLARVDLSLLRGEVSRVRALLAKAV